MLKLFVDVLIMTSASIMLWCNWIVSSFTMVPWRCEYSFYLFARYVWITNIIMRWIKSVTNHLRPLGCMAWLVIAVTLMLLMKESMEVYDGYGQKLDYSLWNLLCAPYSFKPTKPPPRVTVLVTILTRDVTNPQTEPIVKTRRHPMYSQIVMTNAHSTIRTRQALWRIVATPLHATKAATFEPASQCHRTIGFAAGVGMKQSSSHLP